MLGNSFVYQKTILVPPYLTYIVSCTVFYFVTFCHNFLFQGFKVKIFCISSKGEIFFAGIHLA